jgi:hypothetical protein
MPARSASSASIIRPVRIDAGNDAELDFRLTELRIVGGDDEIALQCQFATAAEREARHRRDHRLARLCDAVPIGGEITEKRLSEALGRHLLDVGAGGESLVRSGKNDAADRRIGLESSDGAGKLPHQHAVERVERLRTIEPDQADAAPRLDDDIGEAGFDRHGLIVIMARLTLPRSRYTCTLSCTPPRRRHSAGG